MGSVSYVDLDSIQRPSNGAVANPAWGDQVNDNIKMLAGALAALAAGGRAYAVNPGAVGTTTAAIATNNEDYLNGGVTLVGGALKVPVAGVYFVRVQGKVSSVPAGYWLQAHIMQNGNVVRSGIQGNAVNANSELDVECADCINASAGDTFNLGLVGSSTGVSTNPGTGANCSVTVQIQSTATGATATNVNSGW